MIAVVMMMGHRKKELEIFYPEHAPARALGAEAPEPTSDPKVAYSDVQPWAPTETPDWPLED